MAAKYKILNGLSWDRDPETKQMKKRAEPGETRDDLDPKSIPWLLEEGHIQLADLSPTVAAAAPVPAAQEAK